MNVTKRNDPRGKLGLLATVLVLTLVLSTLLAAPTLAARKNSPGGGGGGNGGGGSATSSGSLALVMVNDLNGDGSPDWSDTITWSISTSDTTTPYVSVSCYQNGTNVYNTSAGFFADYPWPWTVNMTLRSSVWTGGAADCTATLYYPSGTKTVIVTTVSFAAGA